MMKGTMKNSIASAWKEASSSFRHWSIRQVHRLGSRIRQSGIDLLPSGCFALNEPMIHSQIKRYTRSKGYVVDSNL